VGLGPFTIHFYALCILLGIVIAIAIGRARYRAAGGIPNEIYDLAIYVIPAGIIGGRIYHVITSPELYFGKNGDLGRAIAIWDGGMGIWGAVALGTLVGYLYFRRSPRSSSFSILLDALAPGILCAQAVGRVGNWFNGELFGRPTRLPWGLSIPLRERPIGYSQFATFQPTFLYEAIWCLAMAALILYLPVFKKLAPGNTFLAFIALYCLGRLWVEALRIDTAHHLWGVRLNDWVAGILLLATITALVVRERNEKLPSVETTK
jgi:prolipoprotein diacylglyceryl transferase